MIWTCFLVLMRRSNDRGDKDLQHHPVAREQIQSPMTKETVGLLTIVMLAGCVSVMEEQAGVPMVTSVFQTPTATTCKDALYHVVQAERAYDQYLAGTDQVREAVLVADRLCGK